MNQLVTIALAVVLIGVLIIPNALALFRSPPDNADEIRDMVNDGEALLVDVRTGREYSTNGLDEAINIPVQELSRRYQELGSKDQPIVVYCRSGNRSSSAKAMLEEYGFEEVHDLGALGTAQKVMSEESSDE